MLTVVAIAVACACAASRRVWPGIPWVVPIALFVAYGISAQHAHDYAQAAGSGDDNGDIIDALNIVVLVASSAVIGVGFLLRRASAPRDTSK